MHTQVYAQVVSVSSELSVFMPDNAKLYAFIGDECRGEAKIKDSYTEPPFRYFQILVGGEDTDIKKEISFKLVTQDGFIYDVATSSAVGPCYFLGDETYGKPSDLVQLRINGQVMTDIYVTPNIYAKVGEMIEISELISPVPSDCVAPSNFYDQFTFDFTGIEDYAELVVDGGVKKLKAKKATTALPSAPQVKVSYLKDGQPTEDMISLRFSQPITSITLKDGFSSTFDTTIGAQDELTNYLNSCWKANPDDADPSEVSMLRWKITPEDQDIIEVCSLTVFNPVKVGTVTATLVDDLWADESVQKKYLSVTINVQEALTAINTRQDVIYGVVGDDFTEILKKNLVFNPSTVENKQVTIVPRNKSVLNDNLVGVSAGTTIVDVTSVAVPSVKTSFEVTVGVIPTITVVKDELKYYTNNRPTSEKLTADMLANYTVDPSNYFVRWNCAAGSGVLSIESDGESAPHKAIVGTGHGTTEVVLVSTYIKTKDTATDGGTPSLFNEYVAVYKMFDVTIEQVLEGFSISPDDEPSLMLGETHTWTITPIPADYSLDMDKFEVKTYPFKRGDLVMENLEVTDFKLNQDKTVSITVKALSMGRNLYATAKYEGVNRTLYFNVTGVPSFTAPEGWSWKSFLDCTDVGVVFGMEASESPLVEIRSQRSVLYNDPVYGYFGSCSMEPEEGYKVKLSAPISQRKYEYGELEYYPFDSHEYEVDAQWNWIGFPYQYRQELKDVFVEPTNEWYGPMQGDKILSKSDGFAIWNGTEWEGSLRWIEPGEGYLYYSTSEDDALIELNSEYSLPGRMGNAEVKAKGYEGVWKYDDTQFADNMALVAKVKNIQNTDRYTIGAFVNGECRGEGQCVNGKFFVTIHGKSGEKVSFRLHDELTDEYADIEETVALSKMAGSLDAPVELEADLTTTGIQSVTSADKAAAPAYNTLGQRVKANAKGLVISGGKKYNNK